MKNINYANRGRSFEEFIRFANSRYSNHGIAEIVKQPTEFIPLRNRAGKVTGAKVENKATVDFIGRYKHYPIAIEAKHTKEDSIRFDRIEQHQEDFMNSFTAAGGTVGIILLSFDMCRFFAVPWTFWKQALYHRVHMKDRKSVIKITEFGQTWEVPMKMSVRINELLPEWEIPSHSYLYGLPYLHNADKYILPMKNERMAVK